MAPCIGQVPSSPLTSLTSMNNTLEIKIYKNSIKEITNKAFNSEFVMKVQKPALVKKIKEFD